MTYRRYTYLALFFLSIFQSSYAQFYAPKYSNEFLSIGVGARAIAMSGAQTAVTSDVTSAYWNPAGLLRIQDTYEGALMHSEYFAGIAKYDYAGFSMPLDTVSRLGISIIRFGVDDIPDTRFLYDGNGAINYDNITFFSAADYAFLFSYARTLPFLEGLRAGANVKIIHRSVGDFAKAWGFGLDAGLQWEKNGWMLGLTARDITGTFNAWSHNSELVKDVYNQTGNVIPENTVEVTLPKLLLGAARGFRIREKFGILTALDLDLTFDGKRNVPIATGVISADPHLGVEMDYIQTAFLRFGVGNVQHVKDFDGSKYTTFRFDFGIGVKISKFSIDYALTDVGNRAEALYSHVFSIKAAFNK